MTRFFTPTFLCLVLIGLAGCKKGDEKLLENNPTAELKGCPIERIIYYRFPDTDTITFTYNSWDDPVSGTRSRVTTGAPNYEFRYDKKHRLTDFIGWYGGDGAEYWHKYFYDNAGSNANIIADSVYAFVRIQKGNIAQYYGAGLTVFAYDKKGRIIMDSTKWRGSSGVTVNHYSYNENGNLRGKQYDENLNPHRTNKIWMFLDRDYSVNNPFVADSYNLHRLPTKINLDGKPAFLVLANNYLLNAQLIYGCK